MIRKRLLYIQFYQGVLARLEKRSVQRVIGDLAVTKFVHYLALKPDQIDLQHDYDLVILGPAPLDFPEEVSAELWAWSESLASQNFPTLGIGFGALLLAPSFGFTVDRSAEQAVIDQIQEYTVRNLGSEISPAFDLDLTQEEPPTFSAYTNYTDRIVAGDKRSIVISSKTHEFAGVAFSSKIFGVCFIPYLDETTYYWWRRPYPDFWLNLKGFWQFGLLRENKILRQLIRKFTYKYLFTAEERATDQQIDQQIVSDYRDLTKAKYVLRNFVTKIAKV